jgi:Flp pilus assembly protein TadD
MGINPAVSLRFRLLTALVLILATTISYWGVWKNDFVNYDDTTYVIKNRHVTDGLTRADCWWALTECRYASNWHPLTWLSLQLDSEIYRSSGPAGFHFTNLVLHLANVVLLFFVLEQMTAAVWPSALVAALFALHPLHVESVAWLAERKDVLSTLFWILTMAAYVFYVRRPGWCRYVLVLLAFAPGLMAKPMLVTLPCVLLLLDYWPLGRLTSGTSYVRVLLEKMPLFGLAAGSCVLTLIAQGQSQAITQLPISVRLENAVVAVVTYLGQTIWPWGLAVFYPHAKEHTSWVLALLAGLLLLLVTVLAFWRARSQPYLLVGWLWYLGTLVPVIGLVQVGMQAHADRYTYIPSIGLFLIFSWGLDELTMRWRVPMPAAGIGVGAVLVALGIATHVQVGTWQSSITLWDHALAVTEDNYLAHSNLGMALLEAKRAKAAREHFEKAVEIHPFALGEHNLALAWLEQGNRVEAILHFRAALKHEDDFSPAQYNLALLYDRLEMLALADRHYTLALRFNPEHPELLAKQKLVHIRQHAPQATARELGPLLEIHPQDAELNDAMGWALSLEGKKEEALAYYQRAVERAPAETKFRCDLALAFQELGREEAADSSYRQAVQSDPGWLAAANWSAWSLATDPSDALRDGARAVRLARQICQATAHRQADYLDTLAAACAEIGNFEEAQARGQQALKLASSQSDALANQVEQRLERYARHQPYRQR